MTKKHTAAELGQLCRVAVMIHYSDGGSALVALFTAPPQAEAFVRAKRLEQGGSADPEWRIERI